MAAPYVGHFHEYLLRSGFPQPSQMESIHQTQRLLREDIIDKALNRDMTAMFGVRLVLELEQTFLYLCLHDGGLYLHAIIRKRFVSVIGKVIKITKWN